ncbi:MAG: peptidase MA family metallohydrolase [Gemmatimonadota bacterium]
MKFLLAALAAVCSSSAAFAQNLVRSGDYIVYSWTANDRLSQRVINDARAFVALPALPATAPTFGEPITIVLADNDRRFRELTGNRAPEWGVGVAAPAQGLIALRAYGGRRGGYDQLTAVLRHELAHIALHRYLRDAYIPRWFDEGYATWAAGELDGGGEWRLRVAFALQKAPSLDSLGLAWPAMSSDARIAYLLAASVVKYLVNESGTRALELFMSQWRDSGDFEAALAATYGISIDQLEIHWRRDLRRRYGWFAVLTQSAAFVSFAAIGVLALYFVRRRRDRLKMELLRATEPPDEPAYWNPGTEPEADTETDFGIDRRTGGENIPRHG